MSKIWLVDDSDLEREIAVRTLAPHHEVQAFDHGDAVLARIESGGERPDILVLDYHLPGLSGLQITRVLRERWNANELPILMLSSTFTASEDVVAGLESGANDYVIKPFAEIELRARIDSLVQAKQLRERAELAERSLRQLLNHLPDAFFAVDAAGLISFANRAAELVTGRDWSELFATRLTDIIPALAAVQAGGAPVPAELSLGERMYEPALGRLTITGQAGETLTVTLRDVTDKLLAIRRRDHFLAMLAHELRNPLAAVLSATQVIQLVDKLPDDAAHAAEVAERQVNRLVRIVDDLLDVSRVSHGRIELRREPVDVTTAIESALDSARPQIQARRHAVVWQAPAGPIRVLADPLRFEQILTNLVTNAAKYSEARGRIEITASVDGEQVVIGVRDQGIGLPAGALDSIFELFVQMDDSLDRAEGGLGIGLPLVRQLVQLHGGTVHAESEGPGKGSLFVLRLPLSHEQPRPASTSTPPPAGKKLRSRRVMLVDDNEDAVGLLADVLQARGHEVQVAHDARGALEIARGQRFDIAFLDIGLPGESGYVLAPRLRDALAPHPCVLVAVTGYGQPEDVAKAREAGFDHHFIKPVSLADLEGAIAALDAA